MLYNFHYLENLPVSSLSNLNQQIAFFMRQLTFSLWLLAFITLISFKGLSQVGRVGINTTTPQAMLHVKDSSVLFSGATSLPVTPGDPPASGAGVRMMWYPDKAAFRVGSVNFANWDKDSIGDYSFSAGFNSKGKGFSSTAIGTSTNAAGPSSVAMGTNSLSSSFASVAIGNQARAIGNVSTAMGYNTEASGNVSVALGNISSASGDFSTAIGSNTNASGDISTSIGLGTNSRPYGSLTIGRYNDSVISSSTKTWIATDPLFIVGNGTSNLDRNNALVVFKNGNATLDGELTRPSSGTDKNLLPICYGSVSGTGTINSGTSNFTASHPSTGQYDIVITGESYSSNSYVTNVTVVSFGAPRMATTVALSGVLTVRIWDAAGTLVDGGFHFIVYKQ